MDLRYFKKSSLQCWFHWNTALHFVECNLGERPVIYLSEVFSNTDTECSHSSSREQQTWQRWRGQSSSLKIIFNKYLSFKQYFYIPSDSTNFKIRSPSTPSIFSSNAIFLFARFLIIRKLVHSDIKLVLWNPTFQIHDDWWLVYPTQSFLWQWVAPPEERAGAVLWSARGPPTSHKKWVGVSPSHWEK